MFIIGITGGTGAGKSTAVKALQALGAEALDCDVIYHELLSDNADMISEIKAYFGDALSNGKIDRRKLSEIVWSDADSLKKLNLITHKYVDDEIDRRIAALKEQEVKLVAVDAIALVESGQNKKCDVVIGVIAPQEKRASRIMSRDSLSKEHALKRISAQQPESFYRENCDYILENAYSTEGEFEEACIGFFNDLLTAKGSNYECQSGGTREN